MQARQTSRRSCLSRVRTVPSASTRPRPASWQTLRVNRTRHRSAPPYRRSPPYRRAPPYLQWMMCSRPMIQRCPWRKIRRAGLPSGSRMRSRTSLLPQRWRNGSKKSLTRKPVMNLYSNMHLFSLRFTLCSQAVYLTNNDCCRSVDPSGNIKGGAGRNSGEFFFYEF